VPVELLNIPLNSGVREDLDSKLLPDGMFKQLINCRLRKGGELGVRHGYRALGNACFGGGTLKAFDLVSHNETLLAFGSERSTAGGPEKVFTWNENTSQWKGEDTGTRPRAFGAISELEQVFRPPFVKVDEDQFYDIAYANNHVALVYEEHATSGGVVVHIFDPDNGSVLFSATVAGRTHPRVVGVGSVFVFCWQDSSDDVRAATFTVGSSTALSAETVLHNTGTVGDGIDLAPVSGASEFILLVVRSDTNVCTIRRCTTGLSVSATGTLTDTDISLASVASATGATGTVVAYVDTSGNYLVQSFNTSTLASAVGPTALFGGSTGTRVPAVILKSATEFVVAAAITDTIDHQLKVDVRALSNHAASAARTFREVSLQSKPFVSPDGLFVGAVSPYAGETLLAFTGIFDLEHGRGYECAHHRGFGLDALPSWLGSVATDGTRFWAVFPVTDLNCQHTPVVMQFRCMSPERRQTASLGGLLYVAGGFVGAWDGVRLVEAGFFDTPVIDSATPSNGAGAMTPNSLYVYAVAYEWYDTQGNRHLSPVSDDTSVTMGASDDTVTLVVSAPHSLRGSQSADTGGKVIVYRTKVAPDRTKRRASFEFSTSSFAQSVTITDLASDDEISTQEVIYTQGSRGTLSGPLQHEAPFPAQYLCAGSARIACGGLPNQSEWQRSKRFFPSEPIEWSGTPGHFGTITGRITAVFSQDDTEHVASRSEVFVVGGVGPDDSGAGEFDAPRALPGDAVGVIDWRSVLRTASGTWFQAYPDRLYLLPRGGGAAEWLSQAVRDTLAAFPAIVGGAVSGVDDTAVWACNDAGGTTRRLVCTDLRTGAWYVDDLSELPSGPIQSICEHHGRVHLAIGGLIYRQDTTFPASAFIGMTVVTGSVAPAGTEGYCKLKGFISTGKHRARHKIEGDVSFDDGVTFGTAGQCVSAAVTVNAGFSAGDTVSKTWRPKRRKGDRFVLRLRTTEDSGASEGETLSNITLEVIRKRKSRRSAAKGT
jgi:hypothetical protein